MNILQEKGIRVESRRPHLKSPETEELAPESLSLNMQGRNEVIGLDTSNEAIYKKAEEIDPDNAQSVYHLLKKMRDRLDWMI